MTEIYKMEIIRIISRKIEMKISDKNTNLKKVGRKEIFSD